MNFRSSSAQNSGEFFFKFQTGSLESCFIRFHLVAQNREKQAPVYFKAKSDTTVKLAPIEHKLRILFNLKLSN